MQTSRRKFFGIMAATPLAGKAAAEEVIAKQTGIGISGLSAGSHGAPGDAGSMSPTPDDFKAALNNPVTRSLFESLVYEDQRNVFCLDHDIAVQRSISLSAKIVYQRQRNVATRIQSIQGEYPWSKMTKLIKGALGLFR